MRVEVLVFHLSPSSMAGDCVTATLRQPTESAIYFGSDGVKLCDVRLEGNEANGFLTLKGQEEMVLKTRCQILPLQSILKF